MSTCHAFLQFKGKEVKRKTIMEKQKISMSRRKEMSYNGINNSPFDPSLWWPTEALSYNIQQDGLYIHSLLRLYMQKARNNSLVHSTWVISLHQIIPSHHHNFYLFCLMSRIILESTNCLWKWESRIQMTLGSFPTSDCECIVYAASIIFSKFMETWTWSN